MKTQDPLQSAMDAAVFLSAPCGALQCPPGLTVEQLHRFSVDEYRQLGEMGILHEDDRVELIEGIIVAMSPNSIAHRYAVDALLTILPGLLGSDWYPSGQNPLRLSNSEPEPDVAILRGSYRDYRNRHPEAKDAGLVIEVADSSLDYDRRAKGFLYSRHEVPEYWIVNLIEECVEIYRATPGKTQHFLPAETYSLGTEALLVIVGRHYGAIRISDLMAGGASQSGDD